MLEPSDRLKRVPPYLFAELDRIRQQEEDKGRKIISLAIGDPVDPTPAPVIQKLHEASQDPSTHSYPPYEGTAQFRNAVVRWYRRRFGVELTTDEVLTLIGSKEGIAHIFLAFVNPGELTLVPDPGYPVYRTGTFLAGGTPFAVPLLPERGFLPDLSTVPAEVAKRAKILFLNYPNNPTAAVAPLDLFQEAVEFAKKYQILLCHDHAYAEVTFDGYRAPSLLQVKGAEEIGIEFGSLSKPYNMTGWRIGYAVGSSAALKALGTVKNNIDSGVFKAVQEAGIKALDDCDGEIERMKGVYQMRRDRAVQALTSLGWKMEAPKGTFYLWVPIPGQKGKDGMKSREFTALLLQEAGVMVAPGIGYGETGDGHIRLSLTVQDHLLDEALERIAQLARERNLCGV